MGWPFPSKTNDAPAAERRAIAAARAGDRAGFESLQRIHAEPLRRFLLRRAAPHIVDDILQETWIAAWQGIARYSGRSSFKAWLYAIASHKCVNYHRQRTRQMHWECAVDDDIAAPGRDDYRIAETRQVVQAALAGLTTSQREVIEMYYYDELTLPEIAQVLNRNLNTVKYQFYRAHTVVAGDLAEFSPATGGQGGWHKG